MIAFFIAFSSVFVDSGFSFALIRKKNVSKDEYDTVFWFKLIISILIYLLLWLFAPLIAGFYDQPILKDLVRVLGLNLIINAAANIQHINLRRNLQFKELTIIGISTKIVSGIVSVILAYKGFGVWSLVIQEMLSNALKAILLFFFNYYIPRLKISIVAFKDLFGFSSKLLLAGIIEAISKNIYPLVIGKLYMASDVGYFSRARSLQQLPVMMFTNIIQQVTLPSFSKIQDQDDKFKLGYKKAIRLSSFVILLPLMLLFVTAYPFIEFLITEKWLPSAPMLQIFAVSGIFYPLSALNVNIIGIKGRSDYVLYLQIMKSSVRIVGLIIGSFFGLFGLVLSYPIVSIIAYYLNAFYANKVINYPIKEQLSDLLPFFTLAVFSGIIVFLVAGAISPLVIKLTISWAAGFFVYYFTAIIIQLDEAKETKTIMLNFIKRKNE